MTNLLHFMLQALILRYKYSSFSRKGLPEKG